MNRPSYVCNACHGIGLDDASGFGNFTACEACKGEGSVQQIDYPKPAGLWSVVVLVLLAFAAAGCLCIAGYFLTA
jgi:DnaJ-class molecular chaperone